MKYSELTLMLKGIWCKCLKWILIAKYLDENTKISLMQQIHWKSMNEWMNDVHEYMYNAYECNERAK